MKKTIITFSLLLSTVSLFSQNFNQDAMTLSGGFGLGNTLSSTSGLSTIVPPISLCLEKGGKWENISFGLLGTYYSAYLDSKGINLTTFQQEDWRTTVKYFAAAVKLAYHYNLNNEKLDPYVGILLGTKTGTVTVENTSSTISTNTSTDLLFAGFAGARYYFSENFAAYGELGYGVSWLTLGVTYRFFNGASNNNTSKPTKKEAPEKKSNKKAPTTNDEL